MALPTITTTISSALRDAVDETGESDRSKILAGALGAWLESDRALWPADPPWDPADRIVPVKFSVDGSLLKRLDEAVESRGTDRAKIIDAALRAWLEGQGRDVPLPPAPKKRGRKPQGRRKDEHLPPLEIEAALVRAGSKNEGGGTA